VTLAQSYLWKIVYLTIIEFTEKCFFDLVDVLDVEGLRMFFYFKLFNKVAAWWTLSVFADIVL
jgi:hypothetical protein